MRRIQRAALPTAAQSYLSKRQLAANDKHKNGDLNIERDWKSARQTRALKAVVTTLQTMMGPRQRCMYCLDSHGADIEHFRPKTVYPKRMYEWPNLLLCCTECGRFKGNQFPLSGKQALLIDPTREDPWKHLDFDPVTGNISARFDVRLNDWSAKGAATVDVLKLDRREALSAGYLKTLRHLSGIVERALLGAAIAAPALMTALKNADDHGLLAWCFSDRGQTIHPFKELQQRHPAVWRQCCKSI
ncbi:MAG: TIGR02646 family protein [Rhodoferax sp.]|jgi:uncharacterized protein (TIGR02646 family)|nr:TIGR02646 family protein [Rhodoferax sp.]